jgi:hypothetical protein
MAAPTNQAAWLITAGTPLKVDEAPLPTAGPGELVVKNAAVASMFFSLLKHTTFHILTSWS